MQANYDFRQELLQWHRPHIRQLDFRPEAHMLEIDNDFTVWIPRDAGEVLTTAARDLQERAYHIMQEMNGIHPGDPTYNTDQDPANYKKTM